ncbi:hypothetical protein COU37_01960 [Candidatus Micrarchaeota archaeon CG10_big_fil_rev_8_21_14_0_10_45_29]|nr:MAG: hypothetical protein COU37_01960 [Candidatus Micrarchaeota archaeon CG10_big_fil_rev_8_21_14_0_10_45_29]
MATPAQLLASILLPLQQAANSMDPLEMRALITICAITLYAIFAGSFYETLSKRAIFRLQMPKPLLFGQEDIHIGLRDIIVFIFEYTIIFPLITLIWVSALTIFLLALSSAPVADVAILSLSIVAATRICAYYDEQIAVDVAKLLPIALLALVVADPGSLSQNIIIERSSELLASANRFFTVFAFLIAMEWSLRLLLEAKYIIFGKPESDDSELDKLLAHYSPKKKKK